MTKKTTKLAGWCCLFLLLGGCAYVSKMPRTYGSPAAQERLPYHALPQPEHVVIVVEENKAYSQIIGNPDAPFINRLAAESASFVHAYAETHPSEPNYLALFSGSTQGVARDRCRNHFSGPNLASALVNAGFSFAVYSQSLPVTGFDGCRDGLYVRKHNPAVDWQGANVAPEQNRPFREFPTDLSQLPTVALVTPDIDHDMHSASIRAGDRWLDHNLGRYADWARRHNSLLIITWDEGDRLHHNHIPTLVMGQMVAPGRYTRQINHYRLLRTLEAMYHLPLIGNSAKALPITTPWRRQARQ